MFLLLAWRRLCPQRGRQCYLWRRCDSRQAACREGQLCSNRNGYDRTYRSSRQRSRGGSGGDFRSRRSCASNSRHWQHHPVEGDRDLQRWFHQGCHGKLRLGVFRHTHHHRNLLRACFQDWPPEKLPSLVVTRDAKPRCRRSARIGQVDWSGPIVITEAGTYSGNWRARTARRRQSR